MLGSVEPKFWRAFCAAAERPDWVERYAEPMPQTALIADLAAFFGALPLAHIIEQFEGVDCCLSPVIDLGEALTSPQIAARGLVQRHGSDLQALFPALIDGEAPARAHR